MKRSSSREMISMRESYKDRRSKITRGSKDSGYPSISVVIPVYNEQDRIGRCLESIRKQDYPGENIEIIVVDDGSTDGSADISRQYGVKVLHQKRGGPAVARNRGVIEASADIVGFIDADDVASDSWLREAVTRLSDERVAAVGCCHNLLNKKNDLVKIAWLERDFRFRSSHEKTDHLGASGCVYKKNIFLEVGGFDAELLAAEEWTLSRMVRRRGYTLLLIKKPLISVEYQDTPLRYMTSQVKKSAYVLLFHSKVKATKRRFGSSYSGLVDYIQALLPPVFFLSLFFIQDFRLAISMGVLSFLLFAINAPFVRFVISNSNRAELSKFKLVILMFYLVLRSLSWSLGLIYGTYLIVKHKLRTSVGRMT